MTCARCGAENPERAKFCLECGSPLETAESGAVRKTVTIVFCDVTGSTELGEANDPETVRVVLARYFERMRGIVEAHGGVVEKFIGDAVMAVFGVPTLHEDDALRATRAALEMRDALPELGVRARIGVNTGEVVTGTSDVLATGDAVNVAARLEQAAAPDEVLLGAATVQLIRDAVVVEPIEPLSLKGKAVPVQAFRLVGLTGREAVERRLEGAFVGRGRELRHLNEAFELAADGRTCHLFTLLGVAGVGKSRLVLEFLRGVDATVVRGRCLSYGEGITYWPVVEVVKQLQPEERDLAATVVQPLRVLLGSDEHATADEIAFAVRKLFEHVASERPLVVVWDDLHWAEQTFLDLIEHVADWSRDAPILLLCMARPELLDRRAGWAGGKLHATTVLVEPLGHEACETLLDELGANLEPALRSRVLAAADGNPLFVEEMVAMVRESPSGDIEVPPTITALLSARLDQLATPERAALACGSIEGPVFHRTAVEALDGDSAQLPTLVRKELVRPDKGTLPDDDAFRFRHILVRDAAYAALPKATRARLHERFADWLELRAPELIELDEIVGYHLEQSTRYRHELDEPETEHEHEIEKRAAARLFAAGARAFARRDGRASANLLERGLALLPEHARPPDIELKLALALQECGALLEAAERTDELARRGAAGGDRRTELYGRLAQAIVSFLTSAGPNAALTEVADEAQKEFEPSGDDVGLGLAWFLRAHVHHNACEWGERQAALERMHAHGERAGDVYLQEQALLWMAAGPVYGPMPTDEGLRWYDEHFPPHVPQAMTGALRAVVEAMVGNVDGARSLIRETCARLEELGQSLWLAGIAMDICEVEMIAGDFEEAARAGIAGCERLQAMGEQGWLSTCAGLTALALLELGRDAEAEHWIAEADRAGGSDDVITQAVIRQGRAKLLTHQGDLAQAEAVAREAVELMEPTDMLAATADAKLDLAAVLRAAGKDVEAVRAAEEAAALYERKRDLMGLARARSVLGVNQ